VITNLRTFYQRRFMLVGVPYLCWTVIYFFLTYNSTSGSVGVKLTHLAYLMGTGYYQLYYLVVLMQFYVVFPLLLVLLRRTRGHHGALLLISGVLQLIYVSLMHWGVVPREFQGFWASREIMSYQFYLVAGMVVAVHFDVAHQWVCTHVRSIVAFTLVSAGLAELWFFLAQDEVVHWLGPSSDPFQPIVIPFNIGAIACIYLVGVALVDHRRSNKLRTAVQSGSDNSYGVYLAQLLFITVLGWLGWTHLNSLMPWPVVSILTVALVFLACVALTALLARTPLARPLTGRTRVPWKVGRTSTDPSRRAGDAPGPRILEPVGSD
jgi:peptidoglycan/LPS O-acetylase OafA/YrhL